MIDDKCKAFKVYLLRKNRARYISPDIREGHNNFIKIVELLFDTWGRFRGNDKAILIREKMNKMEKVEFRTWLDEKINELLNKVELRTNISK